MKKLNMHALALGAVALIVFVVLAFLLPFVHNTVFWIAFGAAIVMGLVAGVAFIRSFRKDETLESKVLGWPIFKVALIGLVVQAVLSLLLMALAGLCPVWIAVLAEVLVFAAVAALLIVRDAGREVVTVSEQALPDKTQTMKNLRLQAKNAAALVRDARVQKAMEELAEEMQFSDPVSSGATEEMETALAGLIAQVKLADTPEGALELVQQAKRLLKQRNETLKMSK